MCVNMSNKRVFGGGGGVGVEMDVVSIYGWL